MGYNTKSKKYFPHTGFVLGGGIGLFAASVTPTIPTPEKPTQSAREVRWKEVKWRSFKGGKKKNIDNSGTSYMYVKVIRILKRTRFDS